jgi:hypothetical protein
MSVFNIKGELTYRELLLLLPHRCRGVDGLTGLFLPKSPFVYLGDTYRFMIRLPLIYPRLPLGFQYAVAQIYLFYLLYPLTHKFKIIHTTPIGGGGVFGSYTYLPMYVC